MLKRAAGFSLIELMVAVAVFSLLLAVAVPSLTAWVRNERVRTVAEVLQSGIRVAQAEAQRRGQTAVFFRTASATCDVNAVPAASGTNWQVRVLPVALLTGSTAEAVRCGVLSDIASGVALSGPAALCFSATGRLTSVATPAGAGSSCELQDNGSQYDLSAVSAQAGDRKLRVLVALGGSVRLCDPDKNIASSPDGCPAVPAT